MPFVVKDISQLYPILTASRVFALDLVSCSSIDPLIPDGVGNKAYKLAGLIPILRSRRVRRVLSFGGHWSNHLHCLAQVLRQAEVEGIFVVRGSRSEAQTAMLQEAIACGAQVCFVSKEDYRTLRSTSEWELKHYFGVDLVVPEGGNHPLAQIGLEQLGREIAVELKKGKSTDIKQLWVPIGTGATLAGILLGLASFEGLPNSLEVIGVNAVKKCCTKEVIARRIKEWLAYDGATGLKAELVIDRVMSLLTTVYEPEKRYGRLDNERLVKHRQMENELGFSIEPIYVANMLEKLENYLVEKQRYQAQGDIAVLFTGGLSGRRGYF